jgi:Putative amidoligase enzyme.
VAPLKFSNRYLYPKLHPYEGLRGNLPIVNPSFYVGIEVEAEGVAHSYAHSSIPGSWKITDDGSLKDAGAEYVTVPIKFKYIEMELRRLFWAIPKASFSSRTSIHVHMNARDFTDEELMKFLLLYLIYERNLYTFSGDRWLNNFCIPLHSNPEMARVALYRCKTDSSDAISWCKYHGLNLLPLMGEPGSSNKYGTLEFRHMIGNNNVEYIMDWCNIILSLKLAAKKMSVSSILQDLIDDSVLSPQFTHQVFGQWGKCLGLDNPVEFSKLKESILATKILCLSSGVLV